VKQINKRKDEVVWKKIEVLAAVMVMTLFGG